MAGLRRRLIHSTRFQLPSWANKRTNKSVEDCPESCLLPDLPLIIPFFPSRAECSLKHSSSVDDIKSDQRYWQKRLQLRHSCTGEDTPTFTSCCRLGICSCTSPRTTPAQSSHYSTSHGNQSGVQDLINPNLEQTQFFLSSYFFMCLFLSCGLLSLCW